MRVEKLQRNVKLMQSTLTVIKSHQIRVLDVIQIGRNSLKRIKEGVIEDKYHFLKLIEMQFTLLLRLIVMQIIITSNIERA